MPSLILRAHAKVNLHLHIGPKRPDGYHSLQTLFQEISLHDTLHCRRTNGPFRLDITPAGLPTDHRNLVIKALILLKSRLKSPYGMDVRLIKRIPQGAGLGGGSSDAAAALRAGWLLWRSENKEAPAAGEPFPPFLKNCAAKLGADVSFFLSGGLAWSEGIGEKCRPLRDGKRRWMILIYPRVSVNTAKAYRLLDEARIGLNLSLSAHSKKPQYAFNSFEPIVFSAFPEISKAFQTLVDLGCSQVMMSGSGSTVYGFVKSRAEGLSFLTVLRKKPWDVFLVHTLA